MQNFSFWTKRRIRIFIPLFIFIIGAGISGSNKKQLKPTDPIIKENWYQEYLDKSEEIIGKFDDQEKAQRNLKIKKLHESPIYSELVNKKIVSTDYLEVLDAISNGISRMGSEVFFIEENILTNISEGKNGDTKKKFVINTVVLGMDQNGGIPIEIIEVFERYRKAFRFYGEKGSAVSDGNKTFDIPLNFDLTGFFAVITPKNENVLNAVYEARSRGISTWTNIEEPKYAYLSTLRAFTDHLKVHFSESPYLYEPEAEVSAKQLYSVYENNQVNGDKNFKNKLLVIEGTITDFGTDMLDKPFLSFELGEFKAVTCYFDGDKSIVVSELSKGDRVSILGICSGNILGNIVIEDCQIWY